MYQNFKPHLICNHGNRKCDDRIAILHQNNGLLHLDFCCKEDTSVPDNIRMPIRWCELEQVER